MWLSDNSALASLISPELIKRDDFLTQTRAALRGLVDPRRAWHGNLATRQPAKLCQSQSEKDTTLLWRAECYNYHHDDCYYDASIQADRSVQHFPNSTGPRALYGRHGDWNWHVRE